MVIYICYQGSLFGPRHQQGGRVVHDGTHLHGNLPSSISNRYVVTERQGESQDSGFLMSLFALSLKVFN